MAAISPGLAGEGLTAFHELKAAGAVALSDDGCPVTNSLLMRRALEYARTLGTPILGHEEDLTLNADHGHMNEGVMSSRLGLAGKPNASEDIHVARDLMLAELTGGHIHLQHCSTRHGVELIRRLAHGPDLAARAFYAARTARA